MEGKIYFVTLFFIFIFKKYFQIVLSEFQSCRKIGAPSKYLPRSFNRTKGVSKAGHIMVCVNCMVCIWAGRAQLQITQWGVARTDG